LRVAQRLRFGAVGSGSHEASKFASSFFLFFCQRSGDFELRRDFDSSLSAGRRRDPSPVTARQSWYPDLLMRPSHASISRLASFLLATLWAISSSDAALTTTARGARRRDPPPATSRKSWYPDLLMRLSQASISRLAELKCCASLCFSRLLNGYILFRSEINFQRKE
jgi:hypothetical protein